MKKKNMILKRTVTGLAASLLAVSMIFTGCGKSNSNSSSNNNVNNTTGGAVTSENVTTARPEPETSPRIELEGEEVPAQLTNTLNVIDDKNRNYYEIFVGSFYDSNGDGMGDLQGVIQKLDYINDGDPNTDTDLGCNGIWLMPINPSPSYHKYDVKDYKAIDEQYGTMDDFKQLIEECNKRGWKCFYPPLSLCGDNGAMIGSQAYYEYLAGNVADMKLNAAATMDIATLGKK